MTLTRNLLLAAMLVLALVLGWALMPEASVTAGSADQSAADFYRGNSITAIAPAGASSTFTLLARVMEPYLEKYTGAEILVRSMQAGGGYQARNFVYAADPDGLTLILVGHGPKMITGDMFDLPGVSYRWNEFVPLGKIVDSTYVVFVAADSPWQDSGDLRDQTFNFGESTAFFGPQFAEALGWNQMGVVPGYTSSAARATAVARGEIEATAGSLELLAAQPDAVRPLVTALPLTDFPDVPTIVDAATESGQGWASYVEGWMNVMYMAFAPPGIPEDRAAFLEQALHQTWADPEFAADLLKLELGPTPRFVSREILQRYMDRLSSLSQAEIDELNRVINEKYKKS